jgi:hypothetical protein
MNLTTENTESTERTQHTPGPWQVSPYGNITSKSGKIASVEQMPGNYESEKQANARLIASAPHLLAILNEVCMQHDMGLNKIETSLYDIAKTALRKAKGETT